MANYLSLFLFTFLVLNGLLFNTNNVKKSKFTAVEILNQIRIKSLSTFGKLLVNLVKTACSK